MSASWLTAWLLTVAWFAVAFLGALIGTGLVLRILRRRAILDHPNERSSHAVPTPRGGGIALVFVLLPAWSVIALGVPGQTFIIWLVLGAALLLAGVSWADDLVGISRSIRFAAHIAAVSLVLSALPRDAFFFQGVLPLALDRLAAGILWVWFINLFNFMDGIDGIAGAEAAAVGFGLFLITAVAGGGGVPILFGLTLAATALGFLWWNWHPAQVFLGDVGSVPLGYLLGWLLLEAALKGFWAPALILPLYYLADSTITLLRRLVAGERIWQAHSQHFYQRAVRRGLSHATVVRIILLANGVLIVLALLAAGGAETAALLGALATVAALLTALARWRGGGAGDGAPGEGSDR